MIKPEIKFTEKELIAKINGEFGANALNRSMLAYMRDIRKLIPKPIRLHTGQGRGGAYSYYMEETFNLLKLIFKEKIHNGKNLKEIKAEFQNDIDLAYYRRAEYEKEMNHSMEEFQKSMEKFNKQMTAMFEPFRNIDSNKFIRNTFISQLKETINALEEGDDDKIDQSIEKLQRVTGRVKQLRLKAKKWKAAKQGKEVSDKK